MTIIAFYGSLKMILESYSNALYGIVNFVRRSLNENIRGLKEKFVTL